MDVMPALPRCIRAATEGYRWTQVKYGNSGAAVYRLDPENRDRKPDRPQLYVKSGTKAVAQEIIAEAARLQWLRASLPVPEVHQFCSTAGHAWLLTTALPGHNAYDSLVADPAGRSVIVEAVAEFLLRLHALPVAACPFNNNHDLRIIEARRNIDCGRVNEHDFDPAHEGWTAEQVWNELQTLLPLPFDSVVAHGDFSLGNILLQDRKVTGCIDVGRAGMADRYQDLAILWNDLTEFGQDMQVRFYEAYGVATPDLAKLQFHLCLDELF